jgi:DUF4097 and DUF4098 domain-containing protein YvlB
MDYHFDTPSPIHLYVEIPAGDVRLEAADVTTTDVVLEPLGDVTHAQAIIDEVRVEHRGDDVYVRFPKHGRSLFGDRGQVRLIVRAPSRSAVTIKSGSADVTATGRFGEVEVTAGSGDVRFESTGRAAMRSGSGEIHVADVDGALEAKSGSGTIEFAAVHGAAKIMNGSGDVRVGVVDGELSVKSGSGDVSIADAAESVQALSGSGDLAVERIHGGMVRARTGSGDVRVGVADGIAVLLDVSSASGSVRSELESAAAPEDDRHATVAVKTGSGDIVLTRV